ncbi:MAG TPA: DUF1552 domain-containing protein [Polyangiaceae bacterium]|nr:DUF1552 domain-containing protein [Polyangiaceae bacterium]
MKRFKVSRRLFLGGAGAVLALPMLESAMPRTVRAEDGIARRFLAFYVPNGIHMQAWTPSAVGANYDLTPILSPLEDVKSKLLVLTGVNNTPGQPEGPGDHAGGTSAFLTCRHVVKTEGADIKNGISVDQVIANEIGHLTRIPSMQLGTDGGSSSGGCDSGYSCAYTRNISWASETQPLSKTVSPQVVFDQLFGGLDPEATEAEKAKRLLYRTSILDYVLGEATSLSGKLGTTDRRKLEEYMDGVRELELKLDKGTGPVCTPIDKPPSDLDYPAKVKLMCDLMALAFQCDATRVITFMIRNAGSGMSHDFVGAPGSHHDISHHNSDPTKFDLLTKIDTWEVAQLAYLLKKLDTIQEGTGTVLDNTAVYFSSEIADGNAHGHTNMPVLLAGGLAGAFTPGRHIKYDGGPAMANLFISIMNGFGMGSMTFGDNGTGPLPQLKV